MLAIVEASPAALHGSFSLIPSHAALSRLPERSTLGPSSKDVGVLMEEIFSPERAGFM